jgi:DNA-binding CsgD family transcriptional regulator
LTGYVEVVSRQRLEAGFLPNHEIAGHAALIAGHVARIEGRDDPALWAAASEQFRPRSAESLTARYRQAEAMLATRRPRDEVRAAMLPAYTVAVEIGARPLAGKFESLARRARIDMRQPADEAAPLAETVADVEARDPGHAALRARGLSDREIEVLTLVAAGYSNADIAERLFISSKTASVHVSHILVKLGVSTRTEAATIGVRLGLPEVEPVDA